ncbi:hypothetical protein ACUXZ5_04585, partial [Alloscardovia omnicolens]|uniref:hypothetical protein n=1 Tax=Alloscardovia omnicolens TaxID=419015 RepID=UPI0040554FB1
DMVEYQSPSYIFGIQNPATIEPEHYTLHKTQNKLTTKNANKNQSTSKQRLNNIFNVPNHAKSQ